MQKPQPSPDQRIRNGVKFFSEPQKLPGTEITIVRFKDADDTFLEALQGDF
jgi:hypothetical protein